MGRNWIKAPLFTIALVVLFGWAGEVVTNASGGESVAVLGEGVSRGVAGVCHGCTNALQCVVTKEGCTHSGCRGC